MKALGHLAGARPLTHVLLDAPGMTQTLDQVVRERPPDVVLAYCSRMARFAAQPPPAGIPPVYRHRGEWALRVDDVTPQMRWVTSEGAPRPVRANLTEPPRRLS
jgi:hypothetical protein